MKEIIIDGKTVSTEEAQTIIGMPVALAQIHAGVCAQLSNAPDEITRSHQAASLCTANAVIVVGQMVLAHLDAGLGGAILPELTMLNSLGKSHLQHWGNFELCLDGKPPALPEDLEVRRMGLVQELGVLSLRVTEVTLTVKALPDDYENKADIEAVLSTIQALRTSAGESFDGAFGKMEIKVSDEQLKGNVDAIKQQLIELAGETEENALKIIDEKLGATDADKKATLAKLYSAQLAADSQGTKNGSTLCAETEIAVAVSACDALEAMLSA